jgi:hypothetical protein
VGVTREEKTQGRRGSFLFFSFFLSVAAVLWWMEVYIYVGACQEETEDDFCFVFLVGVLLVGVGVVGVVVGGGWFRTLLFF